jgi:hypothetical protein
MTASFTVQTVMVLLCQLRLSNLVRYRPRGFWSRDVTFEDNTFCLLTNVKNFL